MILRRLADCQDRYLRHALSPWLEVAEVLPQMISAEELITLAAVVVDGSVDHYVDHSIDHSVGTEEHPNPLEWALQEVVHLVVVHLVVVHPSFELLRHIHAISAMFPPLVRHSAAAKLMWYTERLKQR